MKHTHLQTKTKPVTRKCPPLQPTLTQTSAVNHGQMKRLYLSRVGRVTSSLGFILQPTSRGLGFCGAVLSNLHIFYHYVFSLVLQVLDCNEVT